MSPNKWDDKTGAELKSLDRLRETITKASAITIGVVGFSSDLHKHTRSDAETVCLNALAFHFSESITSANGSPVWCVSGATDLGIPKLAYEESRRLGCTAVGITAAAAAEYPLAELDYLTIVGEKFGDESEAFVSVLTQLWVFGGGQQSLAECRRASDNGISVSVFQGIGGIADELTPGTLNASFFRLDDYQDSILNRRICK